MSVDIFEEKTKQYPKLIQRRLAELRELILATAEDLQMSQVEESIKWGELSYSVKKGSPIRIDWKEKFKDSIFIYFNCNTKLVATFRELYPRELVLHGNRALELKIKEPWPEQIIGHCIELAFRYHSLKVMPLLGEAPRV
ncbi:MAG: DUF1801 domain-containing protein [Kangiellaceae bacterium]|nr:DUF1801 domain-containing protein [Kangiellaceae bacterium]MCW8998932.1 DUF1801 domain-containing protein [Kangiellaceae bacterium]